MNALTRLERLDDLFPEMLRRFKWPLRPYIDDVPGDIRIDVTENDKSYEVRAEVPGVRKEDIHVSIEGNFVSISAEVKKEKEEKSGDRVLVKETYVGHVSRGFSLAHEIDSAAVVAKLEQGVLNLTLPKRNGGINRQIAIQ